MKQSTTPARRPRALPSMGYGFMVVFMFGVSGAKMLSSDTNQLYWMFHTRIFVEYLVYHVIAGVALGAVYYGLSRVMNDRVWRITRFLCIGWIVANAFMILAYKVSNRLFGPESLTEFFPHTDILVLFSGLPFAFLPRLSEFTGTLLRAAGKLLAPLPVVLLIFLANSPQYALVTQPPPPAVDAPAKPAPVLLIVMDCLDIDRTTNDPDMMRRFPNLSSLAQQGTVFTDTRTPGLRTHLSMPAILFQDRRVGLSGPNEYALSDGTQTPLEDLPTWFDMVARDGDFRVLLGFHIDYYKLVGERVDWLRSPNDHYVALSESFAENLRSHAFTFAYPTRVPLLSDSAYVTEFYNDRWAHLAQSGHDSCMLALRNYGPALVGVFHTVLPHLPYLFDADGYRPQPDLPEDELYAQNLEYGDKQLGEMFAELRRQGLWDSATIIVTGDHGYPWAQEGRNPPLVIKLPGQAVGRVCAEETWTCDIAKWLHKQPEFTALRPPLN